MRNRGLSIHVALAIIVTACASTSVAQTALRLTEAQLVQGQLSLFQRSIQESSPEFVKVAISSDVNIDGRMQDTSDYKQLLGRILSNQSSRNSKISNPFPDEFGALWDFGIVDPQIVITGSNCDVTCTYQLFANGWRTCPGTIEMQKEGDVWRITGIDGLFSFLGGQSTSPKAKESQRVGKK
jgi:hypothetical protein